MKKRLSALAVPKLGAGEYSGRSDTRPLPSVVPAAAPGRCATGSATGTAGDVLGYFPVMSLAEARTAASKLIERVEGGAAPPPPPAHPRSALTSWRTHRPLQGTAPEGRPAASSTLTAA